MVFKLTLFTVKVGKQYVLIGPICWELQASYCTRLDQASKLIAIDCYCQNPKKRVSEYILNLGAYPFEITWCMLLFCVIYCYSIQ